MYVSHDLAVVASIADRVAVIYEGRIVEEGEATQVIARRSTSTRSDSSRRFRSWSSGNRERSEAGTAILTVDGLGAAHGRVPVVDDVSSSSRRGACLAIVGESGSGKTTIARCVAGLHAPSVGAILLAGEQLAPRARSRTRQQRRRLQIVFQNPYDSLNPRRRIRDEIARQARLLRGISAGTPRPRSRVCSSGSDCRARSPTGSLASSPAASARGSRSRAPSRPGRSSSCATRSRPRWTCPCRRRCWR